MLSNVEWPKEDWWLVEDSVYDFSEFQHKHPGGRVWFQFNTHRDITILFNTYHKHHVDKLRPILNKYKVGPRTNQHHPEIAIPRFLLPPDFDALKHIPMGFDFENKEFLLPRVKNLILDPDVDTWISFMNRLFGWVTLGLLVLYVLNSLGLMFGWVSPWLTIPMLVVLRTSLAGSGHYYVHAKQPCWGSALFDINYVGTSATAVDGHVQLHHTYTQSKADVKTSFFFSMLEVPTLWRIPGYTMHKLGNMLFGNFARSIEMNWFERDGSTLFPASLFVMRIWLMVEFWISLSCGNIFTWLLQYFCSLWFNTWMVLSSHEFEHYGEEHPGKDWGKFQVLNSYDMVIVGNPWIDLFLSAGLSPHRAHHLLPYQASGFANIASERYIRQVCKEMGIPWHKPKLFWTDRLPIIMNFVFNSPCIIPNTGQVKRNRSPGWSGWIEEQFSAEGVSDFLSYVVKGFVGFGSI